MRVSHVDTQKNYFFKTKKDKKFRRMGPLTRVPALPEAGGASLSAQLGSADWVGSLPFLRQEELRAESSAWRFARSWLVASVRLGPAP